MMRQTKILSKLELANLFNINVICHTKDKKAKRISLAMGIAIAVVILVLMFYFVIMSYGLVMLGAAEIVPAYVIFLSSIFTLLFCAFKAGKIIFKESSYDILTSMPIAKSAIVISRYIRLYVEGLAVSFVVMLPGIIVYTVLVKTSMSVILLGIVAMFLVPIVPVTVSVLLGVIITWIVSRMKHKAIVEALIAIIFVMGFLVVTAMLPTTETGELDINVMGSVIVELFGTIKAIYPPAEWFGTAFGSGDIISFLIGCLVSFALLVVVLMITICNFEEINRRLHITSAKHDYKLGKLVNKSVMTTLVSREARRYFSSGTYVTNTIIGPILAVVFAGSLFFMDVEAMLGTLPIELNVNAVIPMMFAGILALNSPIGSSVSMEGKEFWIIRTLPVSDRNILKAKLLFSIGLLAPFCLVGEMLMIIALEATLLESIWILILPSAIVLCALVIGLAVNLKFPKLKWENDVEVIKQSASALIGSLGGILVALFAAVPFLITPAEYYNWVAGGVFVIVTVIAILVNEKNGQFKLKILG